MGFVSPPPVVEIAIRLRGFSFEQLATMLVETSRGADYVAPFFRGPVEIFEPQ